MRGVQLREPFIKLDDVAGFFVCWPPPILNVLTLSAYGQVTFTHCIFLWRPATILDGFVGTQGRVTHT